jgi:hypothetical protein
MNPFEILDIVTIILFIISYLILVISYLKARELTLIIFLIFNLTAFVFKLTISGIKSDYSNIIIYGGIVLLILTALVLQIMRYKSNLEPLIYYEPSDIVYF